MVSNTLLAGLTLALGSIAEARDFVPRPNIAIGPKQPWKPMPVSAPRTKTCFVKPSCTAGRDDTPKILAAFKECNNGGTVVLDKEYTVCSPMDLRNLKNIDVALTGKLSFCADPEGWQTKLLRFPFQDQSSWWLWGGEDINLYGAGTGEINGNGQVWYDAYGANSSLTRPLLFATDGWHGGSMTGLKMRMAPQVCLYLTPRPNKQTRTPDPRSSSGIILSPTPVISSSRTSTSTAARRPRTKPRTSTDGTPTGATTS